MHLCDLQKIAKLADLSILHNGDAKARELMNSTRSLDIAEAVDTVRLFELLHRDEYQPLGIVQFGSEDEGEVKVYFTRLQCGDE